MIRILVVLAVLVSFSYAFASDGFNLCRYAYTGDAAKIAPYLKTNLNIKCDKGLTPILWAGFNGNSDMVRLLAAKGADIKAISPSGRNLLSYAVRKGDGKTVKFLLTKGLGLTSYDGIDQAYDALSTGQDDIFMILAGLVKKPDKTYVLEPDSNSDRTETTLLIAAASNKCPKSAEWLIKKGADVNKANSRGETPLLAAMRNDDKDMAQYLISKGASLNCTDIAGHTPLSYAIADDLADIAVKAADSGLDLTATLSSDIMNNKIDAEEYYISKADADENIFTYIQMAAAYGRIDIAKILMEKGADPNELSGDGLRMDAAGIAALKGQTDMLKFLIGSGISPHKKYYNRRAEGDLGLMYFAGGSSKYTLLSLAAISSSRNAAMTDYLLSLPDAEWFGQNETKAFYENLLLIKDVEGPKGFFSQLDGKLSKIKFAEKPAAEKDYAELKKQTGDDKPDKPKKRTPDTEVEDAIDAGDIAAVKKYIADGYDIKKRQPDAVFEAYLKDRYDMALYLIDAGLDVNRHLQGDARQPSLMAWLTPKNEQEKQFILALLDRGADINSQADGRNLLGSCYDSGDEAFTKAMADRGAEFVCKPYVLRNFLQSKDYTRFLTDDAIKAPREKLLSCVDVTETLISLMDSYNFGDVSYDRQALALMRYAYDTGTGIDYARVTEWLDKKNDNAAFDDLRVGVRYFSGKEDWQSGKK